jgi:glycosyltransferase involved in cell wall biosynthesis
VPTGPSVILGQRRRAHRERDLDHMIVSIVIPAFNEARRLPASMARLIPFVGEHAATEVIIVDDGSTDGTAALAERYLRDLPYGQVIRLPWNSGKGAAVRAGVAAASGAAIVFMDADLASDLEDLPDLLAALSDAEIALGSRLGPGASRAGGRRAGSWAFNQIIRAATDLDLGDTQCGFKAFRRAEAKLLFSLSRSTGFGFDVEILALARSLGYRIAEVPVRWREVDGGRFRLFRHTPAMLVDVYRARRFTRRAPARHAEPVFAELPTRASIPGVAVPAARGPRVVLRQADLVNPPALLSSVRAGRLPTHAGPPSLPTLPVLDDLFVREYEAGVG